MKFIREILLGNGYPIPFVNKIVTRRLKRHSCKIKEDISQCKATDEPSNIVYLPYIPEITTKLKIFSQKIISM